MITLKLPAWVWGVVLIGFLILAFALFRGCENSKVLAQNNDYLSGKHKEDSIKMSDDSSSYVNNIEQLNGQINLNENKLAVTELQLDSANKIIDKLLKKHNPIIPAVDTTITTVPNEYITDCEDCFTNLGKQQSIIGKYKKDLKDLSDDFNQRDKIKDGRINNLTLSLNKINSDYNAQKSINSIQARNLIPRWKLLFSMGVMSINSILPNAAGIGGAYQDKRNRIFAFRYYTSEYGSVKALDIYMPLSLRKK